MLRMRIPIMMIRLVRIVLVEAIVTTVPVM